MRYDGQGDKGGERRLRKPTREKNDGVVRVRLASSAYRKAAKSGKPEAVVKVVSQPRGHRVQKLVEYIARLEKEGQELALEDEGAALVRGPEQIAARCAEWAEDYERAKPGTKRPPRHATHIILSAAAGNTPSEQRRVMAAAQAVLWEKFGQRDYEYLSVLHTDTSNPHVHVVIKNKSRNPDTPKLRLNPPDLFELRTRFAAELQNLGIEQVATMRRDRVQPLERVAAGVDRARKNLTNFEKMLERTSPSVDVFAYKRRQAAAIKQMASTIKATTAKGTDERRRLMGAVRDLNRELKQQKPDMARALDATARKLGKDVARIHGYFDELRNPKLKEFTPKERKERSQTIEKMASQVRRDIEAARRGIQLTFTDPDKKATALKALKEHEQDLLKTVSTKGRIAPRAITSQKGKDYGRRFRLQNDKFNHPRSAGATAPGRISEMRDLSGLPVVPGAGRTQVLLSNDERSRMGDRQGQPDRGMRRPGAGDAGRRLDQRRQQDKGKDRGR